MTEDTHDETDALPPGQLESITDDDPTADLTSQFEGIEPDPADLETEIARRYARGILTVFRARRRLFGTTGMRGINYGKALASAVCFDQIAPEDLPRHVRHAFLRIVYLARFLEEEPNEADLRDYAEHVYNMAARLEEFLDRAFG